MKSYIGSQQIKVLECIKLKSQRNPYAASVFVRINESDKDVVLIKDFWPTNSFVRPYVGRNPVVKIDLHNVDHDSSFASASATQENS